MVFLGQLFLNSLTFNQLVLIRLSQRFEQMALGVCEVLEFLDVGVQFDYTVLVFLFFLALFDDFSFVARHLFHMQFIIEVLFANGCFLLDRLHRGNGIHV